jgi:hypothetical protein
MDGARLNEAGMRTLVALFCSLLIGPMAAHAQVTFEVLHVFTGGMDGWDAAAPLIQASDGMLGRDSAKQGR